MKSNPQRSPRKVAVVLSGGGSRGAYEVGVLSYVLDTLARTRGAPPRLDLLCGTSVGAINACFLAAHLDDPVRGIRQLEKLWSSMEFSKLLSFGVRQALSLHRVVLGGQVNATGLLDVRPMATLVEQAIPWEKIARNLQQGHLSALSVSATEVASGRTVIFMELGPDGRLPSVAPPRTLLRGARIGPEHALASAAIPLLFPQVRIDGELFMDGGVRQNTPIAPALRLGATHVFAIGLSKAVRGVQAEGSSTKTPGAALVLGKVMNAFMLDHIQNDIDTLRRMNQLIDDGERAFGSSFLEKLNSQAEARGSLPYRRVESLVVEPTEDIGRMAASHLRSTGLQGAGLVQRQLLSMLDVGELTESDLASYVLFDGGFTRKLIALGRADAEARRLDIGAFFGSVEEQAQPEPSEGRHWTLPPPVE